MSSGNPEVYRTHAICGRCKSVHPDDAACPTTVGPSVSPSVREAIDRACRVAFEHGRAVFGDDDDGKWFTAREALDTVLLAAIAAEREAELVERDRVWCRSILDEGPATIERITTRFTALRATPTQDSEGCDAGPV